MYVTQALVGKMNRDWYIVTNLLKAKVFIVSSSITVYAEV
jgi:hypothetical protein